MKELRPPLTVDDWTRLNGLLAAALNLGADERTDWLQQLAPDVVHLRPLLLELLAESTVASDDDEERVPTAVARIAADALLAMQRDRAETHIGPWRLVRLIAEGGMGAVWLAERADGAMQRSVALKLPRAEWVDRARSRNGSHASARSSRGCSIPILLCSTTLASRQKGARTWHSNTWMAGRSTNIAARKLLTSLALSA